MEPLDNLLHMQEQSVIYKLSHRIYQKCPIVITMNMPDYGRERERERERERRDLEGRKESTYLYMCACICII